MRGARSRHDVRRCHVHARSEIGPKKLGQRCTQIVVSEDTGWIGKSLRAAYTRQNIKSFGVRRLLGNLAFSSM